MADTPTSAAQPFPWMPQFYCADMYWLVTVESLPRALFNQEADARRYFEAADAPEVGGGLHLWRLNGGHLCRPHVASKDALEVEAVQAQPASAIERWGKRRALGWYIADCKVCGESLGALHEPASAPMGYPFGWAVSVQDGGYVLVRDESVADQFAKIGLLLTPLYTSPQPTAPAQARMPLSEEQVRELMQVAQRWAGPDEGDWRSDELEMALRSVRIGISGESSRAANGVIETSDEAQQGGNNDGL